MSFACTVPNRSILRLTGPDATSLLQGIITQDMEVLNQGPCLYTALLSAQGKFQHDFFIISHGDALLLDTESSHVEALIKKLKMYRLRAKVEWTDETAKWHLVAVWGKGTSEVLWPAKAVRVIDPRLHGLGMRGLLPVGEKFQSPGMEAVGFDAYDLHRLSLGVPDGWRDATDRNVAMELNLDQLSGISFTKGCYVGQEVTARMHYRSVLRKCLHMVQSDVPLSASGTLVSAGDTELGEVRSVQGVLGLALLRIAETKAAMDAGIPLMAGTVRLNATIPPYMEAKIATLEDAEDSVP